MERVVGVVTVLRVHGEERNPGYDQPEFLELLTEGSREVDVATVRLSIPGIAPPLALIVDGECFLRCIDRDDLPSTQAALSMIEMSIIAHHQAPLESTFGTELRRGNCQLLSGKCWRDGVVELQITFRDLE